MINQNGKKIKFKKGKVYTIRRFIALLLLILLIFAIYKIFNSSKNNKSNSNNTNVSQSQNSITTENTTSSQNRAVQEEDITFTLATTGDIMCHNTNFQDAYNSSTKSYDFSYYFTDVKQYLQEADITVGNLETTLSGAKRGYSGYPTFNTPEILAKNLKTAGFNVVSTANNHCMDKGSCMS